MKVAGVMLIVAGVGWGGGGEPWPLVLHDSPVRQNRIEYQIVFYQYMSWEKAWRRVLQNYSSLFIIIVK